MTGPLNPSAIFFDPGGTTGVACITDAGISMCEIPGGDEGFVTYGAPLLRFDNVGCERFTINAATARKTPQYDALYIIGYLKGILWADGGRPLILQTPADAKATVSDALLRRLGIYKPTRGGHANDAARHLVLWLIRERYEPVLQALKEGLNA